MNPLGDNKSRILEVVDLVELVSQTVSLKRRGKDFVGLCPFHQEKTPSFKVDPGQRFFYCFGCKAAGNAIDFVMRRDRVEFREALEILAQRAGIELVRSEKTNARAGERKTLLEAHSAACRFFENLLAHESEGKAARDYLASRGFTPDALKRFRVGLALDSWDALRNALTPKFDPGLLALAGLIKPREGDGHYDVFRNRIMFPIRNEGGEIIAFGGRVMPGSGDPAKYLNSPQTPLFDKSRTIFGIDLARQRIVETRTAAVVEGYTDVVMAHQFGAANVVSVLGTALTEGHVTVLRRYADRIVLLFDADTAGDTAVDRAVQLFLTQPVEIAVASLPEDLDPDEFLIRDGPDKFNELLAAAPDALTYAWKRIGQRFRTSDAITDQQKSVNEYLELLGTARSGSIDPMRWAASLGRVARLTGVPIEQLHRRFKSAKPASAFRRPAASATPQSPVGENAPSHEAEDNRLTLASRQAERWIIGTLLHAPKRYDSLQGVIGPKQFLDPACRTLAEVYWEYQREEGEPVFNELLDFLRDDEPSRQLAIELYEEVARFEDMNAPLDEAIKHLAERKRIAEQERLLASASSIGEASADVQADLLRKMTEQARRPDLRRVGF